MPTEIAAPIEALADRLPKTAGGAAHCAPGRDARAGIDLAVSPHWTMPMPRTPSTAGRPFAWCRPRSATPASPPPAVTPRSPQGQLRKISRALTRRGRLGQLLLGGGIRHSPKPRHGPGPWLLVPFSRAAPRVEGWHAWRKPQRRMVGLGPDVRLWAVADILPFFSPATRLILRFVMRVSIPVVLRHPARLSNFSAPAIPQRKKEFPPRCSRPVS